MIPPNILEACQDILREMPLSQLEKAAAELSLAYRSQSEGKKSTKYMTTRAHKLAYLALRFPSTFASTTYVLKQIPEPIMSLIDFGSGPGTVLAAASNLFPMLTHAHLVEHDAELIGISRKLLSHFPLKEIASQMPSHAKANLVTAAYSLSELPHVDLDHMVDRLWDAADKYLVVIEPGTPYGFQIVHQVRERLIRKGGIIVAPCTHENLCPLYAKGDFCHFAVRFNRTFWQKRVKGGELGYEDEKFSYLIMTKDPVERAYSRVVRAPMHRSGHTLLTLCSPKGLEETTISRKEGDLYQKAKKLVWGSVFP